MSEAYNVLSIALKSSIELALFDQIAPLREKVQQLTKTVEDQASKINAQDAKLHRHETSILHQDKKIEDLEIVTHVHTDAHAKQETVASQFLQGLKVQIEGLRSLVQKVNEAVGQMPSLLNECPKDCEGTYDGFLTLETRVAALEASLVNVSKAQPTNVMRRIDFSSSRFTGERSGDHIDDCQNIIRKMQVDLAILQDSIMAQSSESDLGKQSTLVPTSFPAGSAQSKLLTDINKALKNIQTAESLQEESQNDARELSRDVSALIVSSAKEEFRKSTPRCSVLSDRTIMPGIPDDVQVNITESLELPSLESDTNFVQTASARAELIQEGFREASNIVKDGKMTEKVEAGPEISKTRGDLAMHRAREDVHEDGPVKKLDKDLYRQDWYLAGRPGKLEDFVRKKRTEARTKENIPHTRETVRASDVQPHQPNLRTKKAITMKRSRDVDVLTRGGSNYSVNISKKKTKFTTVDKAG
ncbi:uncharacterized protein PV09_04878 [Verruconis gallopava]|uniref:Uncharacterized protein n=1 Tax=Verruconis gallopava TaxID=253628 RepID=A0A0D2AC32_9PEZI|nr:uncharacterized protein PV09_04878 [Verruconis gallopava]KIW04060.1 hypothetical protein PV09_04878 [Verruconis gallopava]